MFRTLKSAIIRLHFYFKVTIQYVYGIYIDDGISFIED